MADLGPVEEADHGRLPPSPRGQAPLTVLVDTNVVLDLLLDREPFAGAAAELLSRIEAGEIKGFLCATTVTTIHYLATKALGAKRALGAVRKLLAIFEVAPVDREVLVAALDMGLQAFEDAVLHEAARQVSAQVIVSRDPGGFKKAILPICSAAELCRALDLGTPALPLDPDQA